MLGQPHIVYIRVYFSLSKYLIWPDSATYPALQICTLQPPRVTPSLSFIRPHKLPNAPFSVTSEWIRGDDEENPTLAIVINLVQKQQDLVIRDELALGRWLNSSTSYCITDFCWQGWVVFHDDWKALMSDRWSYQAGQVFFLFLKCYRPAETLNSERMWQLC